jgi:hypothetical protein
MPYRTVKKVTPWLRPSDCEVQDIEGGNAATLSNKANSYDGNTSTDAILIKIGGYWVRYVWHSFTGDDLPAGAVVKQFQLEFIADDQAEYGGTSDCLGYFSLSPIINGQPLLINNYPLTFVSGSTSTDFGNIDTTYIYPPNQTDGTGGQNPATDQYNEVPEWVTDPTNSAPRWGVEDATWDVWDGDVSKLGLLLHMDHKWSSATHDGGGTAQMLSLYISDVKVRIFYEIEEQINTQLKSGNIDVKWGSFTIK